jgi:hypothetical protein
LIFCSQNFFVMGAIPLMRATRSLPRSWQKKLEPRWNKISFFVTDP